jgi:hypothetical protein
MRKRILFLLLSISVSASGQVQIVDAAEKFLAALPDSLAEKASYPLEDDERFNWSFVPRNRNGISFHYLDKKQREAAIRLLKVCLSDQGFQKATGVLALEAILRDVERRDIHDTYRDPLNYYFTFFGMPSNDEPWAWRIEGHHLSLNFSAVNGVVESSTPSFMGANPALVPIGLDRGKRILKLETDLGFLLVNSLTTAQLKKARFSEDALPEIVSGNSRRASTLAPRGVDFTDLNDNQKKILLQLLDVYVKNYQLGFSSRLMEKIKKSGIENLSFAWAGSLQPGAGHYYRIQGPMLLIEYDNTQSNANHVHTVVRDLTNDFAEDILREHYQKEHN